MGEKGLEEARRRAAERIDRRDNPAKYRNVPPMNAPSVYRQKDPGKRAVSAFHARLRLATIMQRTPKWANLDAIRALYVEAQAPHNRTGVRHHVDHEIPLQGELVSGLHVHSNMRVIPAAENLKKRNLFDIALEGPPLVRGYRMAKKHQRDRLSLYINHLRRV